MITKVGPLNEARFQVEFWHKTFVLKHVELKSCTDVDCIFGWFGALKVWVSIYPDMSNSCYFCPGCGFQMLLESATVDVNMITYTLF